MFEKVRRDFDARGLAISDHTIRRKMEELLEVATHQIEHELKG